MCDKLSCPALWSTFWRTIMYRLFWKFKLHHNFLSHETGANMFKLWFSVGLYFVREFSVLFCGHRKKHDRRLEITGLCWHPHTFSVVYCDNHGYFGEWQNIADMPTATSHNVSLFASLVLLELFFFPKMAPSLTIMAMYEMWCCLEAGVE